MEILRKPYKKKTSISLIEDLYRIYPDKLPSCIERRMKMDEDYTQFPPL
jgi:hypothetical protein